MSSFRRVLVVVVVLAALGVAADRTLAVRVEVEPVAADADGTLMAVSVAVAPEDRGAVGEDVMLWAELIRGGERVFRRGWALKVEDPSRPLRVEAAWPPGAASLRVELESAGGRGHAVWWGDVLVPDLDGAEEPSAGHGEAPADVTPAPGPDATAPSEIGPAEPSAPTGELARSSAAAAPAAASSPAPEAASRAAAPQATAPPARTEMVEEPSVSSPPLGSEARRPAPAAADPTTRDQPVESGAPSSVATPRPEPLPTPDPEVERAPLRAPPAPAAAALATVPLAPLYLEWPTGAAGAGELTVAVVHAGRPVAGLGPGDLEVRAGRDVPVSAVGGADRAPLLLAVAVDLGPGSASEADWVGRMVGRLAARAADGRGRVVVRTTGGADSGWGVDPAVVPELVTAAEMPAEHDLPQLVRSSLERFQGLRGRAVLVVVTDGSGMGPGESWKEAFEAAGAAGVPVLVAGLWNGDFGRGLRKDLRRLGELSGGAVFYLQGAVQAADLLERYGPVIDGSVAVRVDLPPGTTGVEVRAVGLDDVEVWASTTVR